jgi:hypothetical protein
MTRDGIGIMIAFVHAAGLTIPFWRFWHVCGRLAMLAYRVFPYEPLATLGEAGHPLSLRAQGAGRLDNPGHYRIWYLALEPAGAIAEAFGDLDEWDPAMFECPAMSGSRRALATYLLDDDTPLLGAEHLQRAQRPGPQTLAGRSLVELLPSALADNRLLG